MRYHALCNLIYMDPAACLHQDPVHTFHFFVEVERIEFETVSDLIVYRKRRMHTQSNN